MTIRVHAPDLFPLKTRRKTGFTPERDAYLRAHPNVDPAILADALGLTEGFVVMYQRKLGIRKCVPSGLRRY